MNPLKVWKEKKRVEEMEAEWPLILRSMAADLKVKTPFELALQRASEGRGGAKEELGKALREVESGASVSDALRKISARVNSSLVKRAVAQMIHEYESGGDGEILKRLASEMIHIHRARAREFAARMALFGLLHLAVGCILPALVLALTVVGASFLGPLLTPLELLLLFAVGFPSLSLFVVLLARNITPRFMQESAPEFLSEKEMAELDVQAKRMGWKRNFAESAKMTLAVGGCGAVVAFALMGEWQWLVLALVPPAILYVYLSYMVEKRRREMEREWPDALFQASSLQQGQAFEKIFDSLAGYANGPLAEEFGKLRKQVTAGRSVPDSLKNMGEESGSEIIGRGVRLLEQTYRSGADMGDALRETGEEIFERFALTLERRSLLAMQRYTIFAGILLVPLILGLISNTVGAMDVDSVEEFAKISHNEQAALVSAADEAVPIYLAAFALISSFFLALQDGSVRRAGVYAALMVPIALAAFEVARRAGLGF